MTSPAKQKQKEIKEIAPKTKNLPSIKTEKPKEIDSNASFLKYKHNVLNKRMTDAPSVVSKDYGMEKFNPPRMVLTPLNQIGTVDPLTGLPVQKMTNVPPAPSNTLGQAQPVFNQQTQQNAQGIYGGVDQRQNSVGASALFQRTSIPDNDEPTTYDDRLNFKGETQSQIINKADRSNSVERSEFVRDSIKGANKRIDKAIDNLKNPKMKMTQTFGKIKKTK